MEANQFGKKGWTTDRIYGDDSVIFEQKGFSKNFHEDFFERKRISPTNKKIRFFSYSTKEVLHLSPKEEKQIELIVENIEIEYKNNQDEFSKEIILSQLVTHSGDCKFILPIFLFYFQFNGRRFSFHLSREDNGLPAFFQVVDGKIKLQCGYWDKLSFLRMS